MGKIFYIIGKSSTGKDTIYKNLLAETEDSEITVKDAFKQICLYTTRPKRTNEIEGEEYHFINENQYEEIKNKGLVIEERAYNTVHGIWRYLTVNDGQFEDDKDCIIVGVLESFVSTKNYFGRDKVIPIYIEIPDEERLQRALIREKQMETPRYAELCRRFLTDTEDFSEEKIQAAGITRRFINDDLDRCINEIREYIKEML